MTQTSGAVGTRLGIIFPQNEIGNDPSAIRDFAQAAEGLGYTHIVAFDHVLGVDKTKVRRQVTPPVDRGPLPPGQWHGPYNRNDAFHEPLTLFAFLAAVTQRIEFVTGVLILPQRQTALVAKQAAEVQILSEGRLRLGVGVGWNPVEYEALGQDFHTRGKREDEQIGLLRMLWEHSTVQFDGEWDAVQDAGINPRPTHPIPVWVGGNSPAARQRAARLADGWIPVERPGTLAPHVADIRRSLAEAGRDPDGFGLEGFVNYVPNQVDKWVRQLKAWQPLRPTHLSLNLGRNQVPNPAHRLTTLEDYRRVALDVLEIDP